MRTYLLILIMQLCLSGTTVHAEPALPHFYAAQNGFSSCSLATISMLVNRIRKTKPLSQKTILAISKDNAWKTRIQKNGLGVPLPLMKQIFENVLNKLKIQYQRVLVTQMTPNQTNQVFISSLNDMNQNQVQAIIINFDQHQLLGKPGTAGHYSFIDSWDPKTQQVRIIDPDSVGTSGAYWVDVSKIIEAMRTPDSETGAFRGFLELR